MRMNRAWLSLFVMGCLVCTTAAMADQTQIQVFDENGVQLVDYSGGLTSSDGQVYQKLASRPDGTWTVDVPANSKLTLHLWEDGGNGVFIYGLSAFPALSGDSSNYWVDVVYTPNIGPE